MARLDTEEKVGDIFYHVKDKVGDIPYHVKDPLYRKLNDCDSSQNWKSLLKTYEKHSKQTKRNVRITSEFELKEISRSDNPASYILDSFGAVLMSVDTLYSYLLRIGNQQAQKELLDHYYILFDIYGHKDQLRIAKGQTLSLPCRSDCKNGNLQYQWYRNSLKLDGEINSELKIVDAGSYACVVTDGNITRRSKDTKVEILHTSNRSHPGAEENTDEKFIPFDTISYASENCPNRYHELSAQFRNVSVQQKNYDNFINGGHLISSSITSGATAKYALILCNQNYLYLEKKLWQCLHDALVMSKQLTELGFKVIQLTDVTLTEITAALAMFKKLIIKDSYVFVYLVGHGLEYKNKRFFSPIDAGRDDDLRQHLGVNDILHVLAAKNPKLIVLLCDCCGSKPRSYHAVDHGRFHRPEAQNILLVYSAGVMAYERKGATNGIYVQHLKNYLTNTDLSMIDIFQKTHRDVGNSVDFQVPFYINRTFNSEIKLCDGIIPNADNTNLDKFWNKLHDFRTKEVISMQNPDIEIEVTTTNDDFYDMLLTFRVISIRKTDYCEIRAVRFRANDEVINTIKMIRERFCPMDKDQEFMPCQVVNITGVLNLRKIQTTLATTVVTIDILIYAGKSNRKSINRCINIAMPPDAMLQNWKEYKEFHEVSAVLRQTATDV